jgi:hypothetical protein
MKMSKLIEQFIVKTTTGKLFTIFKYQRSITNHEFGANPQETKGTSFLKTSDGVDATQIDTNTFKFADSAEIVIAKKV